MTRVDGVDAHSLVQDALRRRAEALSALETKAAAISRDLEDAVAAAREVGDAVVLVGALKARGQLARDQGAMGRALESYEEAVEVCRGIDDVTLLAHTLRHVADILLETGRPEAARPPLEEALDLYRRDPHARPLDVANAYRSYAILHERLRLPDQARAGWTEARRWYFEAAVPAGVAEAEGRLAPGSR